MKTIVDEIKKSTAEALSIAEASGRGGMLSISGPRESIEAADIDEALEAFDAEKLQGITRLRMRNVSAFPDCVKKFSNLEELRFASTSAPAVKIPSWLGDLKSLKKLSLSGPISELPSSLQKLTKLESLELSYTEIKKLPSALTKLSSLQSLDLSGSPLTKLSRSMGNLINLSDFEMGGTSIDILPAGIAKCRLLEVKKNGPLWLVHFIKRIVRFFSRRFQFVLRFQFWLYSLMFKKLEAMQSLVNPCGWRLLPDGSYACRRNNYHCCGHNERCGYLGPKGCTTESLSCKLWLCQNALEGLEEIKGNKNHVLYKPLKKYLRMRIFFENLCHAFNIPLKGRASKFDTFGARQNEKLNIYIDRWYDNILLRYWGNFLSVEDAAKERQRTY